MKETLKLGGQKFSLETHSQWKLTQRPGGWLIAEGPGGIRKRFAFHEIRGKLSANLNGYLWHGECAQESAARDVSQGAGDSDLIAQFPGKVRKILAQAGTKVQMGDPLILVEAMKMEFSIKAPYDGRVSAIHVAEGQQLSPGQRFLDLERAPLVSEEELAK